MSKKTESKSQLTVIKWNEEEWKVVATRLLAIKGRDLLSSPDFQEVKAKDVFLAQDGLPADRHRKLISLSQGFSSVRQRLRDLVQTAAVPATGSVGHSRKRGASESVVVPGKELMGDGPKKAPKGKVRATSKVPPDQQSAMVVKPKPSTASLPKRKSTPTGDAQAAPAERTGTANGKEADDRRTRGDSMLPPGPDMATEHLTPAPQGVEASMPAAQRAESLVAAVPPAAQRHAARGEHAPGNTNLRAGPNGIDLVELARPFVAMVCQELASALVNAVSIQAGGQGLSAVVQAALAQAVGRSNTAPAHGGSAGKNHPRRAEYEPPGRSRDGAPQVTRETPLEDGHEQLNEVEVQPLFDPKLPPSANSTFKPSIGLIGTNIRDLEDLQQLYPQLQLIVVATESVQGNNELRNCQRIIGVREEVPAQVDEFLRRVFRSRYVRVPGGIQRVKEQLTAWLDNPSSIESQSSWSSRQPHGRSASGAGQKRGQKHRSRPVR